MFRKLIILTHPRSGSHMLRTMLDIGSVRIRGEVFNNYRSGYLKHQNRGVPMTITVDDAFNKGWTCKHHSVCGFLLHLVQFDPDVIDRLRRHADAVFINLYRRDHLARCVSRIQVRQTKRWQVYREDRKPEVPPVVMSPQYVVDEVERYNAQWREAHEIIGSRPVHELYYEDLVSDNQGEIEKIHKFLGVEGNQWRPPATVKVGKPLKESVINYEELMADPRIQEIAELSTKNHQSIHRDSQPTP